MIRIMIYSLKGGVGKTAISLNLALELDIGIVTNDVLTPFERVLNEERILKLFPTDIMPDLEENDAIFDFGGYPDSRAISVLKQSNHVIIPVNNNDINSLETSVNSIVEIEKYNKNIIIVATQTKKNDFEEIREIMKLNFSYPVLNLKFSKAYSKIWEEKKSISNMVKEGGLKSYHYSEVKQQFDHLIKICGVK